MKVLGLVNKVFFMTDITYVHIQNSPYKDLPFTVNPVSND